MVGDLGRHNIHVTLPLWDPGALMETLLSYHKVVTSEVNRSEHKPRWGFYKQT